MATYYISTTGSDARSNAQAQNIGTPWRTIRHGILNMARGDTLLIRAGTYVELPFGSSSSGIEIIRGLSNSQRTVISAYPGEEVIWTTSQAGRVVQSSTGGPVEYMTFSGITLTQSFEGGNLMRFDNVNHVSLLDMTFRDSVRGSMLDFNSRLGFPGYPGGNIVVKGCLFMNMHNNATQGAASHHTYWAEQTDVLFEDNIFLNATIDYTNPQALSASAIMGGGPLCARWTVRDNYIENVSHGIRISGTGHKIYNNVLFNVRGYSIPVRASDTLVANNTIYADPDTHDVWVWGRIDAQRGIYVQSNAGHGVEVKNNIVSGTFYTRAAEVVAWEGGSRSTLWQNNIIRNVGSTGTDVARFRPEDIVDGTLDHDPQFVDLNDRPGGLIPAENSPAQHSGVDLTSEFTTSFNGVTRPQGPQFDRGAFEIAVSEPGDPDPPPVLPLVTLSVSPGESVADEHTLTSGFITVGRTGDTTDALLVEYQLHSSTTAEVGVHYQQLPGEITIPAGQSSAKVEIIPLALGVQYSDKLVAIEPTPTGPVTYEITTYSVQPFVTVKSATNPPGHKRNQREPGKGLLPKGKP